MEFQDAFLLFFFGFFFPATAITFGVMLWRETYKRELASDKLRDAEGNLRVSRGYIQSLRRFITLNHMWPTYLAQEVFHSEVPPSKELVVSAKLTRDQAKHEAAVWEALPKDFLEKLHTQWGICEARIANAAKKACEGIMSSVTPMPALDKTKVLDLTAVEVAVEEVRKEDTPPVEAKPPVEEKHASA